MWDTVDDGRDTGRRSAARGDCLSHDLPCAACGHAAHRFLACSDSCACVPPPLPGVSAVARASAADERLLTA